MAVSRIDYDTDIMGQLSAACRTAALELSKAENLLEQIRSHSDWTCKEKDAIDNRMAACRKEVRKLSEQQSDFLRAVEKAETEFTDAERSIAALFDGVEDVLGRILAVPVKTVAVTGGGLLDGMQPAQTGDEQKKTDRWEGIEKLREAAEKVINIVSFDDIKL